MSKADLCRPPGLGSSACGPVADATGRDMPPSGLKHTDLL